jgi:hypothetical protein
VDIASVRRQPIDLTELWQAGNLSGDPAIAEHVLANSETLQPQATI